MNTLSPRASIDRRLLRAYLHDGAVAVWAAVWSSLESGGVRGARRCAMRFDFFFVVTALLISSATLCASASENGAAHYPAGTNTVEPALMPAPGTSLWL